MGMGMGMGILFYQGRTFSQRLLFKARKNNNNKTEIIHT